MLLYVLCFLYLQLKLSNHHKLILNLFAILFNYHCVNGVGNRKGFICGIISRDFDITNIYIDGIFKIVASDNLDGFEEFLNKLQEISKKFNISFVISVSIDAETAPDYIKKLA